MVHCKSRIIFLGKISLENLFITLACDFKRSNNKFHKLNGFFFQHGCVMDRGASWPGTGKYKDLDMTEPAYMHISTWECRGNVFENLWASLYRQISNFQYRELYNHFSKLFPFYTWIWLGRSVPAINKLGVLGSCINCQNWTQ